MKLGLIGKSLSHSFSPAYFKQLFVSEQMHHSDYSAYEIPLLNKTTLHDFIITHHIDGFNVTIPYKEQIFSLLDSCSADAQKIGAINTVDVQWMDENKYILKGYNTDWTGFLKSIRPFLATQHQKALILGTGGASKAIAYALQSLGIDYYFVSRKSDENAAQVLSYDSLNEHVMRFFKLIINTTPLGTFPDTETCPLIPYQHIDETHLLCDLVYNPTETEFLKRGKAQGAAVLNGLSMLQFQANDAWEIWKNKKGHSD